MPLAPTATYYAESPVQPSGGGDSNTLVTPSFTPADGEVIVVKATTWDTATASGTPSGGGLTYTSQVVSAPGGFNAYARIFTAVVGVSPGSMTITLSAPAAACYHSMSVERWPNAQLAATPATNASQVSGAPSATITTTGTGSAVSWVMADVLSVDPSTRAYRSSATETALGDGHTNVAAVYYFAYQAAAAPGAQTYGLTAPTGTKVAAAAIEIQAATAAAPAGDRLPFMRPPGRLSPVGRFPAPRLADAVPVASAPTAAEQGSGVAGVATTGVARKVAPQSGRAGVGAAGSGTGGKLAPQLGTGAFGVAGTSVERKVGAQLGTATVGVASTISRAITRAVSGVSTLGVAASGTARKLAAQLGTGTLGAAASGTARKLTAQSGSGTAGLAGVAVDRKTAVETGVGALGAIGAGTDRKIGVERGIGALGAAGSGTARKLAPQRGTAAAGFASTRSSTITRAVAGVSAFGTAAYGTARKITAQLGAGALGATGSGTGRKLTGQLGTSTLGVTGAGTDRKRAVESGTALVTASSVGEAVKRAISRGLGALGVTGFGSTRPPVVPAVELFASAGVEGAPTLHTGAGADASGLHSGAGVDTSAQLTADG